MLKLAESIVDYAEKNRLEMVALTTHGGVVSSSIPVLQPKENPGKSPMSLRGSHFPQSSTTWQSHVLD
jgi:hypothetical protein